MSQIMIPVFGYYNHNNAGDEAFRYVFKQYLGSERCEFVSSLHDRRPGTLIAGGGAIINEYFMRIIADVPGVHFIGCSLPYGLNDIRLIKALGSKVRQLVFRSRSDVEALQSEGLEAVYTPDLVFLLRPRQSFKFADLIATASLTPVGFAETRKKLFVFLSDDYSVSYDPENPKTFLRNESFCNELAKVLDRLTGAFDIVMPSMSVWYSARDYVFAASVVRRMKNKARVCIVDRYVDPDALLAAIMDKDSAVLSMKFHGLVFGLMARRFVVNLGSTRKNSDLMSDAGLSGLTCSIADLTEERLMKLVERHRDPKILKRVSDLVDAWVPEAHRVLCQATERVMTQAEMV